MKKAIPLTLLYIAIAGTILMIGIFIGRRSATFDSEPLNPTTIQQEIQTGNKQEAQTDSNQQADNTIDSENKININTADTQGLESLPGIGPSLAQAIINYRNENGSFQNISDIKNVKGIGDARFETIKDKITVG